MGSVTIMIPEMVKNPGAAEQSGDRNGFYWNCDFQKSEECMGCRAIGGAK